MDDFINTELNYTESNDNQLDIDSFQDINNAGNGTDSTENYLVVVSASIGATAVFISCSCIMAYYMHKNNVDIYTLQEDQYMNLDFPGLPKII